MKVHRAAVFGGSGKIGCRVIAYLEERGILVRALQHRTPVPGQNVERVVGTIANLGDVEKAITGADVVIHLATTKEDPEKFFDVTLRGMMNILEACRSHPIQQLILLGGDAVFGIWFYPHPVPIDETHPYQAYPGYYAFTKVMEETMARQYAIQYGLPLTILRSSWVFDEDDILDHLSLLRNVNPEEEGHGFGEVTDEVRSLLARGEERIPILLDGSGRPLKRHIVHIDDVMQAFHLLLGNEAGLGESFNVAGPAPFTYDAVAHYLSEKTGIDTIELTCPAYHSFEINITKARSHLGYEPVMDWRRIIDRALHFRAETRGSAD